MDYNWLTSVGDHDPITIDANLAEIDFDDFKNEDIQNAYAFSLQSYVSDKQWAVICSQGRDDWHLNWNDVKIEMCTGMWIEVGLRAQT